MDSLSPVSMRMRMLTSPEGQEEVPPASVQMAQAQRKAQKGREALQVLR